MSVMRINEFRAKVGLGEALHTLLGQQLIFTETLIGFRSFDLLQQEDDPDHFVVIEVWDSKRSHQAAAEQIPLHMSEQILKLLAERPTGAYYHR